MQRYSKAERQVMKNAFKHLFGAKDIYMNAPAIEQWMANAPVVLVEYDGHLKKESLKEHDHRMEIIDVYDGNISELVDYLRRLYGEYRSLTKWELIFKICNEISAADTAIGQAITQVAFSNSPDTEVPQTSEELQNSQSSSTEEASTTPTEEVENTSEEATVAESVVEDEPPIEVVTDAKPTVEMPSGNVQEQSSQPLFNTLAQNNNKEELKMSDVTEMNGINEMLNAAKKAAPAVADPSKEQQMPSKANVSAAKGVDQESKARVAELLSAQKDQRNAWTRTNAVTAIISGMRPAALRTKANMGVPVPGETDAEKATEAISKKIDKFIVAVSGKEGITQDAFEAMSDEEKYANVVVKEGVDNIGKAAAMYDLYKRIKQNPLEEIAAFIPGADKVNYPTRGYMLNGQPYPEQEFILTLIDNGMGVAYGEGSVDKDGNDVGEDPVVFKVGIASRQEKAASTGVSTGKRVSKVPVVRPMNKKKFIAGGNHITFLFNQEDTENVGAASFKAAINHGGALVGATVSVYALENGKKKARSTAADGTVSYRTKVVSISVSVPVVKIKKVFEAQFKSAEEDVIVTASRWGVQMTIDKVKGNYGNVTEISSAPIVDVFANVYSGNVKLSDTLRAGSNSIKMLQAAADKQAEADAAASAEELA